MSSTPLAPTTAPPGMGAPPKHEGPEHWDQYLQRRGGDFAELSHLGVYAMVTAYIFQRSERAVSVLDLGCGDGGLYDILRHDKSRIASYLGVDISDWGVKKAAERFGAPHVQFAQGDLYTWAPPEGQRFDRIVFGDSIQCIDNPMEVVKRFGQYLTEDGYIVASLFDLDVRRADDVWKPGDAYFDVIDRVSVRNDLRGMTWTVRMIRPK